jgi:hypothetical protein
MIEAYGLCGSQMPDGIFDRRDGLAMIATGHPLRLLNMALIDGADVRPEAIRAGVAIGRQRSERFTLALRGGIDDRYLPIARELGLVPISDRPWLPGMALHPIDGRAPIAASAGLEIRAVTDRTGIGDHVRSLAAGFGIPEEWVSPVVGQGLATAPGVTCYVGYVAGEPVASGLGVRTGTTIGVYNIATIPTAMRRGYGAAMTTRIVADGRSAGCDVAVLQSSDMGRPVYDRLGFRTVVEYFGFGDPASVAS